MNNLGLGTISFHLAEILSKHGYKKYSPVQYSKRDNGYFVLKLTFDECALIETSGKIELIYAPTINETFEWLSKNYPEWNVCVIWDTNVKGYYFSVQNIETNYDYRMPTSPGEMDKNKMFEWGIEHVLNRLDD